MEASRQHKLGTAKGKKQVRKGAYLMPSFARRVLLRLPAATVKAQDELAALGLDCRLASLRYTRYPGKGRHQI
jgi:hypothetical protein